MNQLVDLALGIVSAMGGFVDIGELVFLTQAGASFFLGLVWVLFLGTLGVILYSEMAGRMTAVTGYTVFDAVRIKLGGKLGLLALVSSVVVTLITACAEVGGMALIIEMWTTWPFWQCACCGALLVVVIIGFVPFRVMENGLGLLGMAMLVFLFAVFFKNSNGLGDVLGKTGQALQMDGAHLMLYAYFAVGILTSTAMPYELIFYTSGAIEDEWTSKELMVNRLISSVGFGFGSLVAFSLLYNAASKLEPRGIDPQLLGATALQAILPFGWWGAVLALIGMFFAITGAAVETSMSIGYMICQFFERPWGKKKKYAEAPLYYSLSVIPIVLGLIAVVIYPQPIQIAEYAVVLAVLALPLSYLAVWLTATDHQLMGMHVNKRLSRVGGLAFLGVLILAAVAAIPLLIVTSTGEIW